MEKHSRTLIPSSNLEIKKGALIPAGNYFVSIGTYDTFEVAIISKRSGEFFRLKDARKGGILMSIKYRFRINLNSKETFTFSGMLDSKTIELINLLKKGKK